MAISNMNSPIEQTHSGKGNPNGILQFGRPLNNRQQKLLDALPEFNSRVIVPKSSVNMADLAALTAETGDEFAMFTKGNKRLIIRGNPYKVKIDPEEAAKLAAKGYRWSGHTHPGYDSNCLQASRGDFEILKCFKQQMSVVYNSKGLLRTFEKE